MIDPRRTGGWRDGEGGYGRLSRCLHWAVAAAVVGLLTMGLLMEWTIGFNDQTLYARIKYAHVSLGVLLVILIVPRVVWRLWSGWPPPLRHRWMRFMAYLVPGLLLATVLAQVITGVSARWTARAWPGQEAASLPFFGLFEISSPLALHRPEWNRPLESVHDVLADAVLVLLALHALAAFVHAVAGRMRGPSS